MSEYVLAGLAGLWLADGVILLVWPRWTIVRIRLLVQDRPSILRWESLSAAGGLVLVVLGTGLPYQILWYAVGCGMLLKGLVMWGAPEPLRRRLVTWCLSREPVDYRFWGLGLCALAMILLHALGWIGRA